MTDFAAVDAHDARELVAMMDATDAWPAVRAARVWVLEQAFAQGALDDDTVVVDAGCGPGTFGASGRGHVIDVDVSYVMLHETRRRRADARVVLGDLARLPLRDDSAGLVHAERVLQWVPDPLAALTELRRVTAADGWIAVTDTDWSTLSVEQLDPADARRLAVAALGWVPHPTFAREVDGALRRLGTTPLHGRTDTVVIDGWDPDDPAQHDGPPGLPLHSIAVGAPREDRGALDTALDDLAERARQGVAIRATLDLVTVVARARARQPGAH